MLSDDCLSSMHQGGHLRFLWQGLCWSPCLLLCPRLRSHTGAALMLIDGRSFLGVSDQRCWCHFTDHLLEIGADASLHFIITSIGPALPTVLLSSLVI